jgi:hypothetical protein
MLRKDFANQTAQTAELAVLFDCEYQLKFFTDSQEIFWPQRLDPRHM